MEEGEEVDIDVLVDHYLRATTPLLQETRATQDSWQQQEEEEASKEIIRRPHSTSGKNYNTENSRDECVDYISNSDDDNKNEEEEDIEALVEGILHGEQHHNSSTRLPHLNENRKLEEEEEEENEQHSPLPQRVAADRRLYRHAHSASSQRSGGGGGGDGD
ncbi:hypothetical protein DQ04_07481000, partial [Trypanosoma grayi]|uniref:hypothetical protein n=1 Tax=Trypanosoma grayi TaxID=71804 RepID=UPI0004F427A8